MSELGQGYTLTEAAIRKLREGHKALDNRAALKMRDGRTATATGRGAGRPRSADVAVRVTSATRSGGPGSIYYPGVWQWWDASEANAGTPAWVDGDDAGSCWVKPANGGTLYTGRVYHGAPAADSVDAVPVIVAWPEDTTPGGSVDAPLGQPAAPTVVPQGATGGTSYGYQVVGLSPTGKTVGSATTTIANGPASLNGTDANLVTWPPLPGATSYEVLRPTGGGSSGVIGTVPAGGALSLLDTGLAGDGTTAPTVDTSGYSQTPGTLYDAGAAPAAASLSPGQAVVTYTDTAGAPALTVTAQDSGGGQVVTTLPLGGAQALGGAPALGGGVVVVKVPVHYTDLQAAGTSKTVTLLSLPARAQLMPELSGFVRGAFTSSSGSLSGVTLGWSGGAAVASSANGYGGPTGLTSAGTIPQTFTGGTALPSCQNLGSAWQLTLTVTHSASLNDLTAGDLDLWVPLVLLP